MSYTRSTSCKGIYTCSVFVSVWSVSECERVCVLLCNKRVRNSCLIARAALPTMQYTVCSMTFRREQDKARHECTEERLKPMHQQQGALQSALFVRGGLGAMVALCISAMNVRNLHDPTEHVQIPAVDNRLHSVIFQPI